MRFKVLLLSWLLAFSGSLEAQQVIRSNASQFPAVRVEGAGSSSVPTITFVSDLASGFYLPATGTLGFVGHLVPGTDATYDLGSASRKLRNLYLSGAISGASFLFGDGSAGSPSISFTSAPTKGFYLDSGTTVGVSGFLAAGADATYDIGLAASKRFRNGFFSGIVAGGKIQVGAGAVSTSNITLRSSDTAGMLSVQLGDESGFGDVKGRYVSTTAGVQLLSTVTQPACASGTRGLMFLVAGAAGFADQIQICAKSGDDAYYWLSIQ